VPFSSRSAAVLIYTSTTSPGKFNEEAIVPIEDLDCILYQKLLDYEQEQ